MITVIDDFLPDPVRYREAALTQDFRTFTFPLENQIFHGIAPLTLSDIVPTTIKGSYPTAVPTLSFLRKSPLGQKEPHFIHTDIDMGDWSSILYLNPDPPPGDGTTFWRNNRTGAIDSNVPHEMSAEGMTADGWTPHTRVYGAFNRMVIWPSGYFHSRSIYHNWGDGDSARLTQVTFGKGAIA